MSVFFNSDLMDTNDQEVASPLGDVGTDDAEVNRISRNVRFDWIEKTKHMTGRERYLALCQKMGLKPKEPRP